MYYMIALFLFICLLLKASKNFIEYEEISVCANLVGTCNEPQNSPTGILLNQFQLFKAFHNIASNR